MNLSFRNRSFALWVAIFLSALNPAFATAINPYQAYPQLNGLTVTSPGVTPIAGLRPYREGGIRLEHEVVDGLQVIHNYGHGGAGLTLSWGTVWESLRIAEHHLSPSKKVVIIGAGVIGLTTAHELLNQGYDVTIVAENLSPQTTSNIAGGLWSPVSLDFGSAADHQRLIRMQTESYQKFAELEQSGAAVRRLPIFGVAADANSVSDKSGMHNAARLGIIPPGIFHAKLPIDGVVHSGFEFQTFLIDTPIYLRNLSEKILPKVNFIQKRIAAISEVSNLVPEASLVFNCSGLGARDLVQDQHLIPVRGQLLYVQRVAASSSELALDYMVFFGPYYLFPRSGELVLGGTFEMGNFDTNNDQTSCEKILSEHQEFLGFRGPDETEKP